MHQQYMRSGNTIQYKYILLHILHADLTMEDFLPKDGDTRAKRVLKELQKFIERNLKVQTKMKSVRTIFFTKEEDGVPVRIKPS